MADRENLHRVLAQAIAKYAPSCRNPIFLRRTITRDDLAREFNIRYDVAIALADWTAAIEEARTTTQQHRPDPRVTHRIHQLEAMISSPSFSKLSAADRQKWLAQLAQDKALL